MRCKSYTIVSNVYSGQARDVELLVMCSISTVMMNELDEQIYRLFVDGFLVDRL